MHNIFCSNCNVYLGLASTKQDINEDIHNETNNVNNDSTSSDDVNSTTDLNTSDTAINTNYISKNTKLDTNSNTNANTNESSINTNINSPNITNSTKTVPRTVAYISRVYTRLYHFFFISPTFVFILNSVLFSFSYF